MSALALPIHELAPVVVKAKKETQAVVDSSHAPVARLKDVVHIFVRTIAISSRLAGLVGNQRRLIERLTAFDFTAVAKIELADVAEDIERMVADEYDLLENANALGSEIRAFWQKSLLELSEQASQLDSIAESLRLECDTEGSLLFALAATEIAEDCQLALRAR